MYNLKINTYLKIILVISFISLISAIYIEFILGHQPCNLCLIERIPYILSIILIILNYILKNNQKFIILLLIFVFSFSFILSFYHFGIEQDYFKESAACGLKNASDIISREEILKQLQVKTVSCKDVTFRILGFSLTTLNMTLSLILAFLLIKIFRDYEKYK
tara:strand:+ start:209 stop:694 length:486 start_codon:yes stop_codon:yes gene_type:complete